MLKRFKDRRKGGHLLAGLLTSYADRKDVVVLAIPPGGTLVGAAIAQELGCPLDVMVVRPLNAPQHNPWESEIVMGAIACGGVRVLDADAITFSKVQPHELELVTDFELRESNRLDRLYRDDLPFPELQDRCVILATDAIVNGWTMRAAIEAARAKGAARVVVAAPAGAAVTCDQVRAVADEFVCLLETPDFCSLALWYDDPRNISDQEVRTLVAPHHLEDHRAAMHTQSWPSFYERQ